MCSIATATIVTIQIHNPRGCNHTKKYTPYAKQPQFTVHTHKRTPITILIKILDEDARFIPVYIAPAFGELDAGRCCVCCWALACRVRGRLGIFTKFIFIRLQLWYYLLQL